MKFYKLSESDLPLIFSLSESEIKVWCWLSVHLPFDNSRELEIDTSHLAEEIGISRRSVQRALKTIQENEVFEVEFTKAKVKRKTSQMSSSVIDVAEAPQMSPKRHRCRRSVTDVAEASQMSPTQAETLTVQAFNKSKIIKTYSDFKKTLSDSQRESFLEFAKKKAGQLPRPPELPQRWIEKNWEELSAQWYKSNGQSSPAQSTKWENDPRRGDWLAIIEETANPLEFATDKEKQDFVRWCNETKQFSWLKGES